MNVKASISYLLLTVTLLLLPSAAFSAEQLSGKQKKAREIYSKARFIQDDKEKIARLKEAIEQDPTFEEAYWLVAQTYKEQGNEASMFAYYERVAKPKYRNYYKTCFKLGKEYYNTGQYTQAKEWFGRGGELAAGFRSGSAQFSANFGRYDGNIRLRCICLRGRRIGRMGRGSTEAGQQR